MSHNNTTQWIFTASATLISFLQQSLFPFLVFMSSIPEKDCSQRYVVTSAASISRAFLATRGYGTIWWRQNVESVVVESGSAEVQWFSRGFHRWHRLSHPCWIWLVGKYPSRDFASSSWCMAIACFSSSGTEMSLILLTQSSSRGKFSKLSFSVRRFHKGSLFFYKRLQVFFCFDDLDSTALHLSVEMIQSIQNIGHVRQNENELRIVEAICAAMLVLSQKTG